MIFKTKIQWAKLLTRNMRQKGENYLITMTEKDNGNGIFSGQPKTEFFFFSNNIISSFGSLHR